MKQILQTIADSIAAWHILINLKPTGVDHYDEWLASARDVFYDKLSAIDPDQVWLESLYELGFDRAFIDALLAPNELLSMIPFEECTKPCTYIRAEGFEEVMKKADLN